MTETSTTQPAPIPAGGAAQDAAANTRGAPFALIIDDQEGMCRFFARALALLGVESATYPTAKPALASLDQRRPDIIFLDIALTQSDAIDVIKGLAEKRYAGAVQLMSGGRPQLLQGVHRLGTRYGLTMHPPLRTDDIRAVMARMGLVRDAAAPQLPVLENQTP
jgi:DNA-binding NtrC family response regulator